RRASPGARLRTEARPARRSYVWRSPARTGRRDPSYPQCDGSRTQRRAVQALSDWSEAVRVRYRAQQRGRLWQVTLAGDVAAGDTDRGQLAHAAAHQAPRGRVERTVVGEVAGRAETLLERHAGRRRGFGQRLGVLEIKAAAVCEPDRCQRELRAGPELRGVRRRP